MNRVFSTVNPYSMAASFFIVDLLINFRMLVLIFVSVMKASRKSSSSTKHRDTNMIDPSQAFGHLLGL